LNSIWNKNIEAFTRRFPTLADIYKEIIQASPQSLSSIWQISKAKNGSPTASENNIRLHSAYNPEREASQTADKMLEEEKSSYVFMGFGLGYQVCALARSLFQAKLTKKKLILIEPDPVHFFAALSLLDWTQVFQIESLILAIGCPLDSIIPLLENQNQINLGEDGVSKALFFTIPSFTAHNQEYFDGLIQLINRNKSKNNINGATYERFVKLWAGNSLKNLCEIKKRSTVADLQKRYKNPEKKAFLLLAAGPSLEAILPYLPALKEKMLFVCVETALHALLKINIQPDFILLTDPQYWAYKHIAGLEAPQSTLICPISVYPSVFRFNCKEILLCSDLFPISRFFEKAKGSFGDLGAGGSVASAAWNLCHLLGAENIYLAGLDLSFPKKQTHIRGSKGERAFYQNANKINGIEKSICRVMYGANPEYGINYLDKPVLTDARMKMFAWWFESRIAACPESKTYTLCPQGLKIPGVIPVEIEKLLQAKSKEKNGEDKSSDINIKKRTEKSEESLSLQKADFDKLLEEYRQNIKELTFLVNKAVEKCIINTEALPEELDKINQELQKNPLSEIIRLGRASEKYLQEHKSQPPELAVYQKLQKELEYYRLP